MQIWDGTVGSGTKLTQGNVSAFTTSNPACMTVIAVVTPSSGSKTYNVGIATNNASDPVSLDAAATAPAFILVEVI
jgi:hypothetical protein